MKSFVKEYIAAYQSRQCSCGIEHTTPIDDVIVEKGAMQKLPEVIRRYTSGKVFLLCDKNTYAAAGEAVLKILQAAGIPVSTYTYTDFQPEPDEKGVGAAVMHFDHSCDIVVTVGSGVLNDIGKIVSRTANKPYIIVATAPSMDGYASGTSSVARDGLKISLDSRTPNVIIGDIDILRAAPMEMLISGLGDMLAKYISLCEWKIANLLIDEYYCPDIANLVATALEKCVKNADGLLRREDAAIAAVFEGLVLGGIAMSYAKMSRPASGMEHYISHIWDMRGLALGTPVHTHGIQCAIGTLYTLKLYEKLQTLTPSREKALAYVQSFSVEDWYQQLRAFMGSGAEAMITLDKKEQKYDKAQHARRLEKILACWDTVLSYIRALPTSAEMEKLLDNISSPKQITDIGLPKDCLAMTIKASKDIRDKYVLSRLLWDLGVLEEFTETL